MIVVDSTKWIATVPTSSLANVGKIDIANDLLAPYSDLMVYFYQILIYDLFVTMSIYLLQMLNLIKQKKIMIVYLNHVKSVMQNSLKKSNT